MFATLQEVIEFAVSSAHGAYDQAGEYASLAESIEAYRGNIRDTLNDEKQAVQYEAAAWAAFDAEVTRLRA